MDCSHNSCPVPPFTRGILSYTRPLGTIDFGVWKLISHYKVSLWKLEAPIVPVVGHFVAQQHHSSLGPEKLHSSAHPAHSLSQNKPLSWRLHLDKQFTSEVPENFDRYRSDFVFRGQLLNMSTLAAFRSIDRSQLVSDLLKPIAKQIAQIKSYFDHLSALSKGCPPQNRVSHDDLVLMMAQAELPPETLSCQSPATNIFSSFMPFFLLCYADIKAHVFYYNLALPFFTFLEPSLIPVSFYSCFPLTEASHQLLRRALTTCDLSTDRDGFYGCCVLIRPTAKETASETSNLLSTLYNQSSKSHQILTSLYSGSHISEAHEEFCLVSLRAFLYCVHYFPCPTWEQPRKHGLDFGTYEAFILCVDHSFTDSLDAATPKLYLGHHVRSLLTVLPTLNLQLDQIPFCFSTFSGHQHQLNVYLVEMPTCNVDISAFNDPQQSAETPYFTPLSPDDPVLTDTGALPISTTQLDPGSDLKTVDPESVGETKDTEGPSFHSQRSESNLERNVAGPEPAMSQKQMQSALALQPVFQAPNQNQVWLSSRRETASKPSQKFWSMGWLKWRNPHTQKDTATFVVDLKHHLDPTLIQADSLQLNIQLIQWRILPNFQPSLLQNLKFLLIGMGTLGCAVARNLVAWGITNLTLIDHGCVACSSPSRQVLYTHEDAIAHQGSGLLKVIAAKKNLHAIRPDLTINAFPIEVPTPGHDIYMFSVDQKAQDETLDGTKTAKNPSRNQFLEATVQFLEDLINAHDVVFLLTDTRESRWLPAFLGTYADYKSVPPKTKSPPYIPPLLNDYFIALHALHDGRSQSLADSAERPLHSEDDSTEPSQQKTSPTLLYTEDTLQKMFGVPRSFQTPMIMTVALGFDSYLILRHGLYHPKSAPKLACYFCNDLDAPSDIASLRPLDQQCTVTRPGASSIAAGFATELVASMSQHPFRPNPCGSSQSEEPSSATESCLGSVPHMIRGNLGSFRMTVLTTEANAHCICCSEPVCQAYEESSSEFIAKVTESAQILEHVSGLKAMKSQYTLTEKDLILIETDIDTEEDVSQPQ